MIFVDLMPRPLNLNGGLMDNDLFNEQRRLRSLCTLGILDTAAEERFDQLTRLAAAAFDVPVSLVSLVDQDRQWFKSRQGLAAGETHRSLAFCSHAIESHDTLVVADALLDPRFADNPLVVGAPRIRFYAGHPIQTHEGFNAGTLCIIDTKPRALSEAQLSMLRSLAKMVEQELNRDSLVRARDEAEGALLALNATLDLRVQERTFALEEKNEALSREIRQRTEVEASLRRSEARVRTMVETSFSAFVAADADGRIIEWNSSAERVFGWSRQEVLGLSLSSTIIPEQFRAAHEAGMARFVRTGLGGKLDRSLQLPAITKSGQEIAVEMAISAFALDGQPYFGAFINDVSAPLEARRALEQKQELLRTIAENLPTLICQVDRHGRFVFLNSRSIKFYGQPAEKLIGQPVKAAYSDTEYAKIAPHIEAAAGGRKSSLEGDILLDGRKLHFHAAFVPHVDEKGEPDGYFAMAFDITTRRESEIRQLHSEERLRTITDNVPVLISYLDSEFRFQFANAMYKEWLGRLNADMLGKTVEEVFGAADFEERKPGLTRALGGNMSNIEVKVHRKGRERILSTTYIPHFRDGKVVGIYVLATDSTAAHEHERQLLVLANEDPLTNLPNRRMYEFHLAKAVALARRQGTALALMYLDLDNFKKINDTLGHGAGDEVLVEFGKRVKSVLRESDMLARLA
ncbi:MAG: hypothetical protein JWQ01_4625, partial [Massilia sp.]|nr:hypothetical protein [Massilia sp.]